MAETSDHSQPGNSIRQFAMVYLRFLKNPVQEIRHLPNWSLRDQVINQVIVTAVSGALSGVMQRSFLSIIYSAITVPILAGITIFVATLFFYFFFQVFGGVTLAFRRLMELMFFANIPFFIFMTVAHLFPPIIGIAMAFSAILIVVGLCDNFQLERKMVIRTVAGVYALFVIVWAWTWFDAQKSELRMNRTLESSPAVELGK